MRYSTFNIWGRNSFGGFLHLKHLLSLLWSPKLVIELSHIFGFGVGDMSLGFVIKYRSVQPLYYDKSAS